MLHTCIYVYTCAYKEMMCVYIHTYTSKRNLQYYRATRLVIGEDSTRSVPVRQEQDL